MKKDLLTHFSFLISYFLFISLFRHWFPLDFLPFWFGGIIGTILPDVDHLLYVYFLKPKEAVSQNVSSLISEKKVKESWDVLADTRTQRSELIFHTAYFQVIFLALTLWVVTSSGSLFGRGLVLAFSLHILIDQLIDLMETKNLDNWFAKILVINDKEYRRWYLAINFVLLLALGFLL
ncbi:hypothetical protein KKB40_04190 [Patescibacteria group bacterium]|nr:hypothetical protein [Patescibacteria group bacterium]